MEVFMSEPHFVVRLGLTKQALGIFDTLEEANSFASSRADDYNEALVVMPKILGPEYGDLEGW